MSNNRSNLDDSLAQNYTIESQRTLVSPPRTVSHDSLEGAVGRVVESEVDRVQRLAWVNQRMSGIFSNLPTGGTRYSMGSRLPAPNNLQAEMNVASRTRLSAGGTQLPFRDTCFNTPLEQSNQNRLGSVQFHPTQVDFTRFSEPVATATQHGSSNSFGIGTSLGTHEARMMPIPSENPGVIRREQNVVLCQNELRPLMNSTIQQSSTTGAPWSARISRREPVPSSRSKISVV